MSPRARLGLCLVLVTALFDLHVLLKTEKIFSNPTWDARDGVGQFWSEAAFHYRFAKFFAEHPLSDWGALAHDRDVQHPDTINDWAEFTVAMEVPVGVVYRWMYGSQLPVIGITANCPREGTEGRVPFHVFLVWYDCLVSSLSLFAIFFLGRALWRSDMAGLLASLFYATLYPSYGRTVKNLFLREDFAIPLILLALFFTVRALQLAEPRQPGWVRHQILAAVAWLAALASWHLTQFVFAVGVGAAVVVYLGKGVTPRVPWLVLLLAAGAMVIPVLWAKQVYISPTFCVLYALALAVWINGGRKRAIKVFAMSLVLLLAVGWLLRQSYGEYAHVYQLFVCKLRHLGVKPANPAALPWEARCLWEGAFNTAAWSEFWKSLGWCLPLAAVVVIGRRERTPVANMFVVFALLLVPLAWMVVRYFTFLGFAVAVVAAGAMTCRIWWKAVALVAAVAQVVMLNRQPLERVQPAPPEYRRVVQWLQRETPTNAVVLASITEAPVFWAHTGRPIILHPKFENRPIRERYRDFLAAIYGTEEQFYEFARRMGADYFVYDSGFLVAAPDSRRYKADQLGELPADCAARQFFEGSGRLRHFRFVFADARFWVFKVDR